MLQCGQYLIPVVQEAPRRPGSITYFDAVSSEGPKLPDSPIGATPDGQFFTVLKFRDSLDDERGLSDHELTRVQGVLRAPDVLGETVETLTFQQIGPYLVVIGGSYIDVNTALNTFLGETHPLEVRASFPKSAHRLAVERGIIPNGS